MWVIIMAMSATLRHTVIHRRRQRHEKRQKLRSQLARATGATERQAIEAKLARSYRFVSPEAPAKAPAADTSSEA